VIYAANFLIPLNLKTHDVKLMVQHQLQGIPNMSSSNWTSCNPKSNRSANRPQRKKDKFVQGEKATLRGELSFSSSYLACMRMRKLGKGQSVVFCIPKEIRFQVMLISGKSRMRDINVSYVLRWAISETWLEIRRAIPLWAVQGQRFECQRECWLSNGDCPELTSTHAKRFLEAEYQSLEHHISLGM